MNPFEILALIVISIECAIIIGFSIVILYALYKSMKS